MKDLRLCWCIYIYIDETKFLSSLFQGDALCRPCFYWAFEEEIHKTIVDGKLFQPGDRVAIGASGGKGQRDIMEKKPFLVLHTTY